MNGDQDACGITIASLTSRSPLCPLATAAAVLSDVASTLTADCSPKQEFHHDPRFPLCRSDKDTGRTLKHTYAGKAGGSACCSHPGVTPFSHRDTLFVTKNQGGLADCCLTRQTSCVINGVRCCAPLSCEKQANHLVFCDLL